MVNMFFRNSVIDQILHVFRKCEFPVRIFRLSAVGVDHDISVADFFDDLQIVCEIALIFSAAHVLCVTALQDDVVILHEAELVFMAHSHDPPLRMGDHDIFDSEVAGCLDDGKDLIRCDMGSSKDCIVIADKFQYRAQFRNDLSVFYDYLHERIYDYHVLQADETPVLVSKENRTEGSKHYMWVYRTGKMYLDKQIVLYEYQPSRNASHPRAFLKDFKGVCVTDGYQAYHTIEKEREDLRIAGCWRHARRRFDEAVKALPKDRRKSSLAYLALKQIQAIYREENKLASMTIEERLKHRQLTVKPLVDAYFTWIKQNLLSVTPKSKTAKGLTYSLNQEKYLKTFLEDGEVPMDNNSAEQAIRPFCVGKKNWVMIDTIAGAEASAIIYSIAETAKSNNLKPYNYFEYLLTEIPKHMEDHDVSFCEDLLPWSDKLPAECRK